MISRREGAFNGLSGEAFNFLRNLEINNNRDWFQEHKQDYITFVLNPLRDLVTGLGVFMLSIDPLLEVNPNKAIARIYRDTRFARDKSPYRTNLWFSFKRRLKGWEDTPGYFFEILPDSYCYGMGFYSASKETMDRLRQNIEQRREEFLQVISSFSGGQVFQVEGEKYKRLLPGNVPAEMRDWYQRKNLYLICNKEIDDRLFSRDLVDELLADFNLIAPFYHYLWGLKA